MLMLSDNQLKLRKKFHLENVDFLIFNAKIVQLNFQTKRNQMKLVFANAIHLDRNSLLFFTALWDRNCM